MLNYNPSVLAVILYYLLTEILRDLPGRWCYFLGHKALISYLPAREQVNILHNTKSPVINLKLPE